MLCSVVLVKILPSGQPRDQAQFPLLNRVRLGPSRVPECSFSETAGGNRAFRI